MHSVNAPHRYSEVCFARCKNRAAHEDNASAKHTDIYITFLAAELEWRIEGGQVVGLQYPARAIAK